MAKVGWVSLHRKVQEHWIWKDANKFQWWVDILLTVNTEDAKVNIGNVLYECKRGSSLMSIKSWADRWNVSKDTARNFLKLLEKDLMITSVSLGKTTRISVCNFDSYQTPLHVKLPIAVRKPSDSRTHSDPNNKDNKEDKENKEDNKRFVPPSSDDVLKYFAENDYSEQLALTAYKYYDTAGWKDSHGKQVKNWKQKMIAVWFKEENKVQSTQSTMKW